jgi:hypothetical protein
MDERDRWMAKEQEKLDKKRPQEDMDQLEGIAGEDGFTPFDGKHLVLCFARGHVPNHQVEVLTCYTAQMARNTIKQRLADGWTVFLRVWGDVYSKNE